MVHTGRHLWLALVLLASAYTGPVVAGSEESGWQTDTSLYLKGAASCQGAIRASACVENFGATVELELYSPLRRYAASLFADYRHVMGNTGHVLSLGASFGWRIRRWEAKSWLFSSEPRKGPGTWLYAARIRYPLTLRHKLGVEAIGTFRDGGSPTLLLGYYGRLSRSISVTAAIGSGKERDPAARIELSWQLD
jgi:hypothetical protein